MLDHDCQSSGNPCRGNGHDFDIVEKCVQKYVEHHPTSQDFVSKGNSPFGGTFSRLGFAPATSSCDRSGVKNTRARLSAVVRSSRALQVFVIVRASVYTELEARGCRRGQGQGRAHMAHTRPKRRATCARENHFFFVFPTFFFASDSAETSGAPARHLPGQGTGCEGGAVELGRGNMGGGVLWSRKQSKSICFGCVHGCLKTLRSGPCRRSL